MHYNYLHEPFTVLIRGRTENKKIPKRGLFYSGAPHRIVIPTIENRGSLSQSYIIHGTLFVHYNYLHEPFTVLIRGRTENKKIPKRGLFYSGAPHRIRTCDLQIRNLMLYPAELGARALHYNTKNYKYSIKIYKNYRNLISYAQ